MTDEDTKLFRGYFTPPPYERLDLFCQTDEQTAPTDRILAITSKIDAKDGVAALFGILKARTDAVPYKRPDPQNRVFNTAAGEILKRGYTEGCTDAAVLFVAMARCKQIPCVLVDTAHAPWVDGTSEKIGGHVFVEAFVLNKWMLVDPTLSKIYDAYDVNSPNMPEIAQFPGGFIAFAKGRSMVEMGATDEESRNAFINEAFAGRTMRYEKPSCRPITPPSSANPKWRLFGLG